MLNMGDLSTTEALSGALGSVSLASWILVLVNCLGSQYIRRNTYAGYKVPQLVENYQAKNAKGISLTFLAVWFVGDRVYFIGIIHASIYLVICPSHQPCGRHLGSACSYSCRSCLLLLHRRCRLDPAMPLL